MSDRDGRLDVGIIGAGKVGPALGVALAGAGHRVVGVSAVSEESKERVGAMLPHVPVLPVTEVVTRADLVLVAIPDNQLADFVSGLAETAHWRTGQIVVHTSATHGLDVLDPALARGVIPLAIHPIMTFTGTSLDVHRLTDAFMAVTAPTAVLPIGQALVVEMGAEPIVVANDARADMAEALDTARSFAVAIARQSMSLLRRAGVDDPGRVLAPLMSSAVDMSLRAPLAE